MDENLNNNEQNLNNDEQNLNNNEQNLNNNMQNNKKNNGSKIAIIVCIVIILLLSGILIGLVVSSSKNNTKQDNNKDKQNSSVGRVEDNNELTDGTKSSVRSILEEINKNNFKDIEIGLLTSDYDYNKKIVKDYSLVENIISIVEKYDVTEKDIKSIGAEMNYIIINYNNNHVTLNYNNNNIIITTGEGESYRYFDSNTNDLTELKNLISNYMNKNEENKTDNKVSKSYFEENKNLNYSSNPADSINGKVAILKMSEKVFQTKMCDGYYEYTDNFGNTYYIKQITNITSEYKLRGNNNWAELFRAVIYYVDKDGVNKSFDTAVIVPTNKQESYIYGPYENYTGTTSFVKSFTNLYAYEEGKNDSTNNLYIKKTLTNEYGDATKTIDVYGREFIQIVGATGRDNIYYINKDNQLCRTSLVDLNTQILASDVKDIQIDQYDKIHAYPLGNSFLNNIAMEDSNVIYENIN